MGETQPYVSIVTPVYNGEPYLRECMESVLCQTYTHWEYLLVDNCSTDATVAIAQEYAARDSRVRVITNTEFLDVMPNWNRALRQISPDSRFCKVLHADDRLFPNCIEAMVSVALKDDRIGLIGAYRLYGDEIGLDWLPEPDTVFSGRDVCRRYLLGRPDIFGSPSNIMMRSDLVRSRDDFYDEQDLHADTAVCFEILKDHDFGYVHQTLTYTRRHNESVTSRVKIMNTQQAAKFHRLVTFGPVFLTPDEYRRRYREVKEKYYKVLVSRYLWKIFKDGRDTRQDFVAYHRQILQDLDETLDVPLLLTSLLRLIRKHLFRR